MTRIAVFYSIHSDLKGLTSNFSFPSKFCSRQFRAVYAAISLFRRFQDEFRAHASHETRLQQRNNPWSKHINSNDSLAPQKRAVNIHRPWSGIPAAPWTLVVHRGDMWATGGTSQLRLLCCLLDSRSVISRHAATYERFRKTSFNW